MNNFRWQMRVGPKRQGFWRPPITIMVSGPQENIYNINPSYEFPVFVEKRTLDRATMPCSNCSQRRKIEYSVVPLSFYRYEDARDDSPSNYICCSSYRVLHPPKIKNVFENTYTFVLYPEFRESSDYSDYIDWLAQNLLDPCIQEFERRWAKAMSFAAFEQYVITSEQRTSQIETKVIKAPVRKVKIS